MKILITGASGFVGSHLTRFLSQNKDYSISVSSRSECQPPKSVRKYIVGDLGSSFDWTPIFDGINVVIHTAGRAHVNTKREIDPLSVFRAVNTAGTESLARQAAIAGVQRFIFISTIGVHGDRTSGQPYTAASAAAPNNPYTISKLEAEIALQKIALGTDMEIVILRPPLVYGRNAPGNFGVLAKMVSTGLPLPLGKISNLRSFVAVENLVDLIDQCVKSKNAANKTFLVSDDEDMSTTDLLKRVGQALHKPVRLIPVSETILAASLRILGKQDMATRLCCSLQADISDTKTTLEWKPPVSVDTALKALYEPLRITQKQKFEEQRPL